MINTAYSNVKAKPNPFGVVTNRTYGSDFWLEKEEELDNLLPLDSILPEKIIINPEEARKTNNLKIIGFSIAATTVLSAAGIFFVLRGGPKGVTKGFQKLRSFIEKKLQKAKLTEMKTSTHYEYLLGKIDFLLGKAEAVNNFTTIKDFTFKKLMYGDKNNRKYTKKIHESITHLFRKLGLKTIANSYSKTFYKFDSLKEMNMSAIAKLENDKDLSRQIMINGKLLTKSEWIKIAKEKCINIDELLKENFSDTTRQARYLKIKKIMEELERSFDEKGPFWFLSKDILNTFVADAKMLPKKLKIQDGIRETKHKISYTAQDLYKDADAKIMNIASYLSVDDKKALAVLNKIRENFKHFSKTNLSDKNDMIAKFLELEQEISQLFVSSGKNADLRATIQELKDLYLNYKSGNTQEILDIYKILLPKDQYERIAKEFSNAVKSLDKSIELETEDFINKSRDLTLGSAPTDIIAVLGGVGTLAYYLGKSENTQERTTITLKYGIPALVGIGVSLYGNTRLFAGSKSLLFATISSVLANRIGSFANNIYINYLKKNGKYIQPEKRMKHSKERKIN